MSIGPAETLAPATAEPAPTKNYAVYSNPSDFPGLFVVRVFVGFNGMAVSTGEQLTGATLDEVRAKLPGGVLRLPPSRGDNPVIVETWI